MPADRIAAFISVALDPDQDAPLYVQLFEQLRDLILDGRLKTRQRLPSTRALADDLGVSRTTTLAAYEHLMSEGYIEGRRGSGAYVAAHLPEDLLLARAPRCEEPRKPEPAETQTAGRPAIVPFDPGAQDARLFPFAEWSRHLARTWRAPDTDLLHHKNSFGHAPLRAAIAAHLRDMRGIDCQAAQVAITSSAAESVAIVARAVTSARDTVLVEDPGYLATYRALEGTGAHVVPLAVDAQGFALANADSSAATAQAVVITPSRHYPLGMTMPLARRLELLKWAEDSGAWIIEDDYDSEYRYVGRPLSALMSLDQSGQVIYLGSFSKTMFKSLRLGFVIVPERLVGRLSETLAEVGSSASAIAQPALAEFMASGQFAAHIRRMRRLYAERQKALLAALDEHLAGVIEAPRQSAGMHIPAFFSEALAARMSDTEAVRRLNEAGLAATPLSTHYRQAPPRHGLLLGFAAFEPNDLRRAVAQMAMVLK